MNDVWKHKIAWYVNSDVNWQMKNLFLCCKEYFAKETGNVILKITKKIDCCKVKLNKSLYSQFFTQILI